MPANLPPVTNGSLTRSGLAGLTINGLGDSITAWSTCQNVLTPDSRFPAWTTGIVYTAGNCVQNGGYAFYTSVGGTAGATPPTPSTLNDGGVTWVYMGPQANKTNGGGLLGYVEAFSLGALTFDMTQGYCGFVATLRSIKIINGGTNYTAPTLTCNQGASATATVVGGSITAVTITNPGHGSSSFAVSVSDSTGSGAVLSCVQDGSGTFGSYGSKTADMVARLPDCLASTINIFTVLGGTNDLASGVSYATIVANLKICYETLMLAGRKVIAIAIPPRSYNYTSAQAIVLMRVNKWIRAYCAGFTTMADGTPCNTAGFTAIALADASGLLTDGSNLTLPYPIGGNGGTAASVTVDGLHPATRGGMYIGYTVWVAAQKFVGPAPASTPRAYSAFDGYDRTSNPGGNILEGLPWAASTVYAQYQQVSNGGNVYLATAGGTSASSGGPSGTGAAITDNTVTWRYIRASGLSVLAGTAGTGTTAGSATVSGSFASGLVFTRISGSAAGTVVGAIENPWSDGHVGQRQVLTFSLGSGATNETWRALIMSLPYTQTPIIASDLGATPFYAEVEVDVSGIANLASIYIDGPYDGTTIGLHNYVGATSTGAGHRVIGASGDVLALPNAGRILLRSTPINLPANMTNVQFGLYVGFDASGGAGSATATIKINKAGIFRAGAA